MILRTILRGGLLAAAGLCCVSAATAIEAYPVDEIRPGLRATVWTVFNGFDPDSFLVEVIDVVPGSRAGGDLILVRALDERVQRTGIAQGMSGSPVVAEGRLIGALAFAFPFATEPIAGVTPFAEMRAALDPAFDDRPDEGEANRLGIGAWWREDRLPSYPEWRALSAQPDLLAERWGDLWPAPGAPAGMTRLLLPLVCEEQALRAARGWAPLWERCGLRPVASRLGGGTARDELPERALRPGDALSVDLVSGDMRAAAIGTVTWVDGQRVWAFGHPFLFGGAANLPVSRARIHTIVPNRAVSFKMGSAAQPIGALIADRRPGVAALLGREAVTIPLDVRVRSLGESEFECFHFEVARHVLMTPGLVAMAAASALSARRFELRVGTLASDLVLTLGDGRVVRRQDLFRTLSVAQTVAAEVMTPVSYLAISPYADFPLVAVDLEVQLDPELRAANVDRVRVMQRQVRPGDALVVEVRLQRHLGGVETHRVELQVPVWVRGDALLVMAGSVAAFTEWDHDRAPEKHHARNQADLLRLIEEFPSDENLIVRLYGASRGVILRGREVSSLPVSKWRALNRSVTGGEVSAVATSILAERLISTGRVILGGSAVEVSIDR